MDDCGPMLWNVGNEKFAGGGGCQDPLQGFLELGYRFIKFIVFVATNELDCVGPIGL